MTPQARFELGRQQSGMERIREKKIALSILNDRAKSYDEPFTITITKFDGTSAEISNE